MQVLKQSAYMWQTMGDLHGNMPFVQKPIKNIEGTPVHFFQIKARYYILHCLSKIIVQKQCSIRSQMSE